MKRVEAPPFILDDANPLYTYSEYPFPPPRKSSLPPAANLCVHQDVFALLKCKSWRYSGLFDLLLWCSHLPLTLRDVSKGRA